MWFSACGCVGIVTAYLFVIITQYYTDYNYSKVQGIATASITGPATNIIAGMAVGLESTGATVMVIAVALVLSYNLGMRSGIGMVKGAAARAPGTADPVGGLPPVADHLFGTEHNVVSGLFGTAVATMGMLSTAVFVLAMSSFGPIADNAGGIVEM